jgi:hypothetical protein
MKCTRRRALVGFFGLSAGAVVAARFAFKPRPAKAARVPLPFTADEQVTLLAAIERVLPGAVEAGVQDHMAYWLTRDRHFATYVKPFKAGLAQLDAVGREVGGKRFHELRSAEQDEVFKRFQSGKVRVGKRDGAKFFENLVTFTIEGFLADPKYGGNRNEVGWKFIGYRPCWWSPRRLRRMLETG